MAVLAADSSAHSAAASSGRSLRHFKTAFAMEVEELPPHTSPSTMSMWGGRLRGTTCTSHSDVDVTAACSAEGFTRSSRHAVKCSPLKRRYIWVPYTAAATSNPDPIFPCALACTSWARLCTSRRSARMSAPSIPVPSPSCKATTPNHFSNAPTKAVTIAAEEPRPVFCTDTAPFTTGQGKNSGNMANDFDFNGRPRFFNSTTCE
mmetsp:Transcript_19157/g.26381  ORF Transcript_19157/g.26381 Transcript_19157/m.26381 type:complete len:205 (+) Transcript_19157:370-984(+)